MATSTLAIMFTDIKGFTERTSASTREGMVDLLREHERLLIPVFRHFQGRIVKTIGDAFLVCFTSPTDAVLCGLTIQEVLRQHNASAGEKGRLDVRVSINVGDVEVREGDLFGEAVNIAARLEGITEAGEVYFTEAVYLTMNRTEAPSTEVGEHTFKGIPNPIRVYKVIRDPNSDQLRQIAERVRLGREGEALAAPAPVIASASAFRSRGKSRVQIIAVAAVLLCLAGAGGWLRWERRQLPLRVDALISRGEVEGALAMLEAPLKEEPQTPSLQALANTALDKGLEQRLAEPGLDNEQRRAKALEWLREVKKSRPYLQGSQPRIATLDAEISVRESIAKRREYQLWEDVRTLVKERYPQDPNVPFVVALILQERYMEEVSLWLFQAALDRGHAKDPRMFQTCKDTFEDNWPSSGYGKDAHAIARTQFDAERKAWASEALEKGGGLAFLNAVQVLEEGGDARVKEPRVVLLRAVREGKATDEALASIQGLSDGGRAKRFLEEAAKDSDLPEAVRTRLSAVVP